MIEYHKNLSLESLPYINLEGLICWEEFRDIFDYEGLYQVSDLGRVKSLNYNHTGKGGILKPHIARDGYLIIGLFKNRKNKVTKIHQIVAIVFLNHTPCGYRLVINHINFIRIDNRAENLEIVTQRENSNRKHLKSTSQYVGVYWRKRDKKWYSEIVYRGKNIYLGTFDDELEASQYYENALLAIKNGTEIKTKPTNFSSTYKGVHWSKSAKKWAAKITVDGKSIHLGLFEIESRAGEAYNKALR